MLITCGSAAGGQAQSATVEGFARASGSNSPMAFSLVRLLRSDTSAMIQQAITNADGRFLFAAVPGGDVRLQILRIGFHPMVSPLLHVEPGQAFRYDLSSEPLPVELPPVSVHAVNGCLGLSDLADDSALATLWSEARKGVEIRRAFELRYRFNRSMRQAAQVHWRLRPDGHQVRVDTVVVEPDSVLVREQRLRTDHSATGYGQGNRLTVPDEKELLDESFLREHCLETTIQRGDAGMGIRFRPAGARQVGYALRGTIWLDSASYLIRRIDYEHLDNGDVFSQVNIDYAPVRVAASVLRLPSGGKALLRPRGPGHWLASALTATLSYTYWGFDEIPPK
ncbi:MAG TPA: carboxypeptidase-like regulatory domain-containing protein [Gemmatimonadaceae bacterium]|nr:carboxypeptidase-like regulatory domain-containing protein [Gemmatimonadaceae bacterium]